jgi:hypothetical protein
MAFIGRSNTYPLQRKIRHGRRKILAELTDGLVYPFPSKTMEGAWVCAWNKQAGELIEFIPNNYLLCPGKYVAEYMPHEVQQNFNSTHFMLETEQSLDHLKSVAENHELYHRFRPRLGGPLYEVWIESQILVEFVSDEIRILES